MGSLFDQLGFLGTKAPLRSDISLVLILITAGSFTIGRHLALKKQYEAHRWVQTATAALNTVVVMLTMVNVYTAYILPGIPGKLLQGDYAVTTIPGSGGLQPGIHLWHLAAYISRA
jgi:hypothetical protein